MKYRKTSYNSESLNMLGVQVFVEKYKKWVGASWNIDGPDEWVKLRRKMAFREIRRLIENYTDAREWANNGYRDLAQL